MNTFGEMQKQNESAGVVGAVAVVCSKDTLGTVDTAVNTLKSVLSTIVDCVLVQKYATTHVLVGASLIKDARVDIFTDAVEIFMDSLKDLHGSVAKPLPLEAIVIASKGSPITLQAKLDDMERIQQTQAALHAVAALPDAPSINAHVVGSEMVFDVAFILTGKFREWNRTGPGVNIQRHNGPYVFTERMVTAGLADVADKLVADFGREMAKVIYNLDEAQVKSKSPRK